MAFNLRVLGLVVVGVVLPGENSWAQNAEKYLWGDAAMPYESVFSDFILNVPPGYRLCGPPADFPASNGVLIPVDKTVTCDQFEQRDDVIWPDHLRFVEWADAAMSYRKVEELVEHVCVDQATGVAVAVKRLGKVLGGLEAMTCIYPSSNGIEEVTHAYHSFADMDGYGNEIRLTLMAHKDNEASARALLEATIKQLKVVEPARR